MLEAVRKNRCLHLEKDWLQPDGADRVRTVAAGAIIRILYSVWKVAIGG